MTTSGEVVVFCGPTISADEVGRVLPDARTLPPVEQGDVLSVMATGPRVIAIVDGYFDRVPAVWHKEILWAMQQGTHVFGASSMGALRAAELHPFGMVGVGRVFEDFCSGRLTDDDEVAVLHGPADSGYRPLSMAMVDLRDRYERAAAAGVIPVPVAERLVEVAKGLQYRDRTTRAVAEASRGTVDERHLDALEAFLAGDGAGLKTRDAHELLDALVAFLADDPPPLEVDYDVPHTLFFDALCNEVDRVRASRDPRSELDPELVLWTGETMPVLRKQQLLRVLAQREVARLGADVSTEEVMTTVRNFRVRYGLLDADETKRSLAEAGLDWPQFVDAIADMARVERAEQMFRVEIDAGVARLLKLVALRDQARVQHVGDGVDAPGGFGRST